METKFKKITDLVPTTSFIFRFSSLTYSYDMFTFHKKNWTTFKQIHYTKLNSLPAKVIFPVF